MAAHARGRSVAAMTGRGVAIAIVAALAAAPTSAAAYPDWRDPVSRRRRAGGRPALPAGPCLRRLRRRRPGAGRSRGAVRLRRRPALVLRAEVHGVGDIRASLRRLRLRARALRRDVLVSASPTTGVGGWHRRCGGRRTTAACTCSTRSTTASSASRRRASSRASSARSAQRAGAAQPGHQRRPRAARRRALRGRPGQRPRPALPPRRRRSPGRPPVVFGQQGREPGQFDIVAGLSVDPGREHAVLRRRRPQQPRSSVLGADGVFEALVGTLGSGPGQLDNPYDTGVDLAGRLFVADNQNHRVVRLDAGTLAFSDSFGGAGLGLGALNNVRGIAVAPAADVHGRCVRHQHVARTRSRSSASTARTCAASAATGAGPARSCSRVTSRSRPTATSSSPTPAPTASRSCAPTAPSTPGRASAPALDTPTSGGGKREFRDPTAVAIDPRNGDVWVAEGGGHRVQKIPQSGALAGVVALRRAERVERARWLHRAARDRGRRRRDRVGGGHPQRPPAAARPGDRRVDRRSPASRTRPRSRC